MNLLMPEHQPILLALAFLVGLSFGSFVNVVALRFLSEQSVVSPPSQCPDCKTPISWQDNIPVVSYILLGGKCRHCEKPISIQYPLVEVFTALLFVFTVWMFGVSWQSLFLLFLVTNLMVILVTDFRESLIFQINSLSLIPAGLLYNLLNLGHSGLGATSLPGLDLGVFTLPGAFVSAVIGVIAAFIFFEGLILLSEMAFGTEGFGHGDTHLMMGVGAYLGWKLMLISLLLGFIIQFIPAFPMLIYQWFQRKDYMSLGSIGAGIFFGLMPLFLVSLKLSPGLQSLLVLACILLTIVSLVVFLRQVKHAQSFTYLPLGPALILGSLAALFWGGQLEGLLPIK